MNRLRAYRDIEDISQEDLGDLLGISPSMVSSVEAGRREFKGDLSPTGYSNDRLDLPDMSEPLHRQRASTLVSSRKRAHELVRLAGEVAHELGHRHAKLERTSGITSDDEIEDLSTDVRLAFGQETSGPIRNLTALVERAGVVIVPIVGLEGIDGLSSWVGDVPVIGVCPTVPGDRFRLTIGHETGHLAFHTKAKPDIEREANRFASALLFPTGEFKDALPEKPQLRDFVALKSSWGVSVAALVYRAHEIERIDDKRYRALQIQMSKWRRNEPASFEPVHGELMNALVAANGGVTEVSRQLGVNKRHLQLLCGWSHLRVA